jgi:hypothetical protein
MENIIPQTINDKFNVLFKYVNNLYDSFVNLTGNYFIIDEQNNQVTITGNTFTINTTDKKINLGEQADPDVVLLHTNDVDDIINETSAPEGSFFLSNDNFGEGYLKVNDTWEQISTLNKYILNSNTSPISSTSGGTSIFGSSNKIIMAPNQIYEIEYHIYFLKNSSSGTLTFVLNYDENPSHHIIHCNMNNNNLTETNTATIDSENINYSCIVYNPSMNNTNIVEITTKSIDINTKNYINFKLYITNYSLLNNIDLLLFNSSGSTTILQNSKWISKKISP